MIGPDAPDAPECDVCGGGLCYPVGYNPWFPTEDGPSLVCPACEARAKRHRQRGDFLARCARSRRGYRQRGRQVMADRVASRARILAAVFPLALEATA